MRTPTTLVALAASLFGATQPTPAQASAVHQAVQQAAPGSYSILFRDRSFDLTNYRRAVRGELDAELVLAELESAMEADQTEFVRFVEALGGRVDHQWWLINGCNVLVSPEQIAAIRQHPRVLRVFEDRAAVPGEFIREAKDDLNHNADAVHALGIKGKGVTIAVVDSGVDSVDLNRPRPHAAFFPQGNPNNRTGGGMGGSRLLANVKVGTQPADDPIGHGTAVAGAAVAGRWNSTSGSGEGIAPEARVVSYSVSNLPNGASNQPTLASAWQRVAADRIRYGIRVAVCSYNGYFDIQRPDQQALDALARSGDVVVVVMAGNVGNRPYPDEHYGATNLLAVGATATNTRAVPQFSWAGPHFNNPTRTYPHLVGNGVDVVLPMHNSESTNRVSRGTSYSAPQVAGAAALYLSQRNIAHPTEVYAAILATTQAIESANPAPYPRSNARNKFGVGYLHIERLIDLAKNPGKGLVTSSSVTPSQRVRTFNLQVQQGVRYAAALSWMRNSSQGTVWSNLDFQVAMNGQTLAQGNSPQNLYEHVRFRAPATGTAVITVNAASIETGSLFQIFSVVATPETDPYVPARIGTFGSDCGPKLTFGADPMPYVGRAYVAELLRPTQPQAVALLTLGVSKTRWGSSQLPLDLAAIGAPGCRLHTSIEATLVIPGATSGPRRVSIGIPKSPAMLGGTIYHQALVLEQTNALGIRFSGAIEATIGG